MVLVSHYIANFNRIVNRLHARSALRIAHAMRPNRERLLKDRHYYYCATSRTHHSIVDYLRLGILSEVSTGNNLLQCGFEVTC